MRLAVVGASARAAAQSALAAGHRVVAADLFADADLAAVCPATRIARWPEEFGPWLAQQDCDGWCYTGGLENYPDLIDDWARVRPLLGACGLGLRAVRDPKVLFSLLSDAGVACPETHLTLPPHPLAGEWLVKRPRSSGGMAVRPWQPATVLAEGELLQQRIVGLPLSAAYVSAGHRARCWGITRQLIAPPWTHARAYQYAGSIGPVDLPPLACEAMVRAGEVVAESFDLPGVWGIDFVLDPRGCPWVIELNPRYTASMEVLERAGGRRALALHVAACSKGELPSVSDKPARDIWGKAYLFAPCDVVPGEGFTQHLHQLAADRRAADIPHPQSPIAQGQPVTTLFTRGDSPREVEHLLQTGMADLAARLKTSSTAP